MLLAMGTSRNTLEEVLQQARLLSEEEQRQLVAELQADQSAPNEGRRQKAMKRWLARAGTGHTDAAHISSRKNVYLAEASATKP